MASIQAIIDRQLRRWEIEKSVRATQPSRERTGPPLGPVVTVSRERGSGGSHIAGLVAQRLDYTLLHRDVIDRICLSSGTRRHIIEALDEHARSQFASWWDSIIAQRYTDANDYVRLLLTTIYSVAELGGVVVVGRGANFIVGPERGLHVRVVAPREQRIQRLVDHEMRSRKDAAHEVDLRDRERTDFIRKVHGRDIADPAGYDLVVNTGSIPFEAATDLIVAAAREKFERLRKAGAQATASAPPASSASA
jgi:cytidylate kinase